MSESFESVAQGVLEIFEEVYLGGGGGDNVPPPPPPPSWNRVKVVYTWSTNSTLSKQGKINFVIREVPPDVIFGLYE